MSGWCGTDIIGAPVVVTGASGAAANCAGSAAVARSAAGASALDDEGVAVQSARRKTRRANMVQSEMGK